MDIDFLCLFLYVQTNRRINIRILYIYTPPNWRYFSSPEPKAQGELIVWDSSRRPSVRASTITNMNISETSWPIIIKFHQEHHWGGGLTALGFG